MTQPMIITDTLPIFKKIWLPLLNLVGEKNEFRIVVTSPDYVEVKVLWGVFSYEKGEKKEFVVRGTEAYVTALMSSLETQKMDVQKFLTK